MKKKKKKKIDIENTKWRGICTWVFLYINKSNGMKMFYLSKGRVEGINTCKYFYGMLFMSYNGFSLKKRYHRWQKNLCPSYEGGHFMETFLLLNFSLVNLEHICPIERFHCVLWVLFIRDSEHVICKYQVFDLFIVIIGIFRLWPLDP